MAFEEHIQQQFNNFYLEPIKYSHKLYHLYADYFELIALFSNLSFVTSTDIINRFRTENVHPVKVKKRDNEIGSMNSEINDAEEQWIIEIFDILHCRVSTYSEQYPFEVNNSKIRLKTDLSNKQKIYLILLLSSNLNYFSLFEPKLTTEFESISFHSLRAILPSSGVVKEFGKNSDYQGNAIQKITELAADLNVEINEKEIDSIQGNQERGLDLIAWIPFNDNIPNMLIIMAQCACGKEWYKKQNETRRFESAYFRFYRLKPINSLFVPYSLSNSLGCFYQSDEINDGTLMFDRKRILDNLNDIQFYETLESKVLIEKCIDFEEDTF